MKKIIVMALSVIVGVFGYTIVDEVIEQRVTTLESEVAALKSENSNNSITTTFSFSDLKVGMPLKFDNYERKFPLKFLFRKYPSNSIYLVPWGTDLKEISTLNSEYTEHYLYLTEVSANISRLEANTEYTYYYDMDYSIASLPHEYNEAEITVKYKGYTDPVLFGKSIAFDIVFGGCSSHSEELLNDNTIQKDGSFEFTIVYTAADPHVEPTITLSDIKIK